MATPRHHTPRNPARATNGPGVAIIGAAKGRPHMPWQRRALDVALELDPDTGAYWYEIVLVTVPRQSGKTTIEGDTADHRCLTTKRGRVWITMQNGKTVDSWMREEHHSDLAAATVFGAPGTASCRYTKSLRAGEVGVRWPVTGATFYTFPPKRDALHSKQADLVFVDEAWVHDAEAGHDLRQAIRPTMATRRGSQLWIVSTEGDDRSEYLEHYVAMARAALGNPEARVCIVDYGIPDDADPEDLEVIAAHHPAYGHTIDMATLRAAREDFGEDVSGWARAYGNRRTRTARAAIPEAVWTAAGRPQPAVPDRAGIGVDLTPAGDRAAIVAGWRIAGPCPACHDLDAGDAAALGHGFVEPLYSGPSNRATVDLLVQLARTRRVPLLGDRASFATVELFDAITRRAEDVETRLTGLGEYAAACSTLERGIYAGTVHHSHDDALDAAVTVATKRNVGDGGWVWGRKDSAGSIAELVAATEALRAFETLPARSSRPRIVTLDR